MCAYARDRQRMFRCPKGPGVKSPRTGVRDVGDMIVIIE